MTGGGAVPTEAAERPVAAATPATRRRAGFRPRPVLVEIASALLVVEGAVNLLFSIQVLINLAQAGQSIELLTVISIALATLNLALGLAVRTGRGWLVTVNVVAVLGFLELLSGTPVGLFFGVLDVFVVLALARERPWFEEKAIERREAGGRPVEPPLR
jgi:hypothetical protein